MSSPALETFLARLYTDALALEQFLIDAEGEARRAGLIEADIAALCRMDRTGLRMAAASYARKREQHKRPRSRLGELLSKWLKSER